MTSSIWTRLNIPATTDERAIKRAYAKALKALDPDDRDGFIALRAAYEAALAGQDWPQEDDDAQADDEAGKISPWAAAYEAYLQEEADELGEDFAEDFSDETPQAPFIDACWQSWWESDSEAALLDALMEQRQTLETQDLDTALDYSAALLDWFYRSENDAPRAFAWAAQMYGWYTAMNDWRMNALYERYPFIANPKLASYPALAQWEDRWQQGFWARLMQVIHPLRRADAQADFAEYVRQSRGLAPDDLPDSLQALHALSERTAMAKPLASLMPLSFFLVFFGTLTTPEEGRNLALWGFCTLWFAYLLSAAMYETVKIAGVRLRERGAMFVIGAWLGVIALTAYAVRPAERGIATLCVNLAAMLMLYMAAVFWQRMLARQWRMSVRRGRWFEQAFFALLFLLMWNLAYHELAPDTVAHTAFVFLPFAGAVFSYTLLRRTALPAQTRVQYASALCYAVVLLPLFWWVLTFVPLDMDNGALPWVVKIYVASSVIGIASLQVYRRWHYLLPQLAGLALFVAFMYGLAPVWLMKLQLALWLVLPFAILATPRWPHLGFVLPEMLRVFTQSILGIVVPLVFWHLGWYLAFAMSIGVMLYLLILDSEIDEALA